MRLAAYAACLPLVLVPASLRALLPCDPSHPTKIGAIDEREVLIRNQQPGIGRDERRSELVGDRLLVTYSCREACIAVNESLCATKMVDRAPEFCKSLVLRGVKGGGKSCVLQVRTTPLAELLLSNLAADLCSCGRPTVPRPSILHPQRVSPQRGRSDCLRRRTKGYWTNRLHRSDPTTTEHLHA